jgi:hypothetical protein
VSFSKVSKGEAFPRALYLLKPTSRAGKTHTFHLTTFTISEKKWQFKTPMSRLEAIAVDDWPGVDIGEPVLTENRTGGPA